MVPVPSCCSESSASASASAFLDCSICLRTFVDNTKQKSTPHKRYLKRLGCGHVFHKGCIDEWTHRGATTCPNCRCCFVVEPKATTVTLTTVGFDFDFHFGLNSDLEWVSLEDVPLIHRHRHIQQRVYYNNLPTHYNDPLLFD